MGLIKTLLSIPRRKKETDYDKIKVTSNGTFYMESKDLFGNKEEALELLKKLEEAVNVYKERQVKIKDK
ncbi:hypothetical protein [Pleomorphovibrio marinus]|uniref:hypothetical protein n=1 Tax=Pleomorphovibrio marinus TaxID=2164132 RepID=UPI000E0CBDF5|nr:hypothetical protein [Pleomorphovibrio marinus]